MAEPTVLPKDLAANPVLARWITVGSDGRIDVRVGKVELGQGILTALSQLAADELGVDLADVRMLGADTAAGPDEGNTAGSLSVSTSGPALRAAAANVRMLFVTAAARDWRVDPSTVTVHSGRFTGPEGQRGSYGELAARVDLEVPADPTVPARAGGKLAGTDVPRLDLPDKVAGRPRYVHDLRLPGQWYARVVRPPSPGARLADVDAGVAGDGITVVRDGSFLAVAGPDEAAVLRAADRVRAKAVWSEADTLPDEDDLDTFLRAGPHETIEVVDDGVNDGTATATGVPGLLAATALADPATYPAAVDPPIANGAGSTRNALPGYDLPNRRVTGHRLTASPIRSSARSRRARRTAAGTSRRRCGRALRSRWRCRR